MLRTSPTLALLTLVTAITAAPAQSPWSAPAIITWPLLDIAVSGDSANGLTVLAIPSLASQVGAIAPGTERVLHVSSETVRRWLPAARRTIDSISALTTEPAALALGLVLKDSMARSSMIVGFDRNQTPERRIFLQFLIGGLPADWTAYGSPGNAQAFLAKLDSVASAHGSLDPTAQLARRVEACGGIPATPLNSPRPRMPTGAGPGGRIMLRFLVDAAGRPVDSSARVLWTAGPPATAALRNFLPQLRYEPARCGSGPVPQAVERLFIVVP